MGKLIQFRPRPKRNLYIADDFYVILAISHEEALKHAQQNDNTDADMKTELIDEEALVNVFTDGIRYGKGDIIEFIQWRSDSELDQSKITRKLKVREFIDNDLAKLKTPEIVDLIL